MATNTEIDSEVLAYLRTLEEEEAGFAKSLLEGWVEESSRDLALLEEAIDRGDLERTARLANGCKGIAASVGALDCAEAFLKLEQIARFRRVSDLEGAFAACVRHVEAVTQQLRKLLVD